MIELQYLCPICEQGVVYESHLEQLALELMEQDFPGIMEILKTWRGRPCQTKQH